MIDLNSEAVDEVMTTQEETNAKGTMFLATQNAWHEAQIASLNATRIATEVTKSICDMVQKCETPEDLKSLIETLRDAPTP